MVNTIITNFDIWTTAQTIKSNGRSISVDNQKQHGIDKLRALILGASLQGLLVEKTESLPKTIDREIANAKKLYFETIGKKPKDYAFGPALLKEFRLPEGWMWKRIGDLCDLQTGATPSTQKKEYYNGDIRWLVSGDINQAIIEDCEGRITEEGLINSNCKILPSNTVLIALNGQGKTRATVALLKVPAACNQSLVGIIPFDVSILDSSFLLLSLRYRYYEIRDITGQNQRRGLNMGLVAELSIPLPPLAEQHRIVAKVYELMVLCDQLEQQQTNSNAAHQTLVETLLGTLTNAAGQANFEASWQRIANHFDTLFTTEYSIDQLKQTILQLAVMGKLVPQDPNDEPAGELLKKIEKEKEQLVKEGKIKKQEKLPKITDEEKPFELPGKWEWVRLGDYTHVFSGNSFKSEDFNENSGVKAIKITNAGVGELVETNDYLPETFSDIYKNYLVKKDDLILALTRPYISNGLKICKCPDNYNNSILNQRVCAIRLINYSEYLYLFLQSAFVLKIYQERFSGSGLQPNLKVSDVTELVIPVPSISEQYRIVLKVNELFAFCDALKERIKDSQHIQVQLAEALVEGALG